ncbi:hypothetical protein BG015_005213, partial [Linnemannia schmuckeri]
QRPPSSMTLDALRRIYQMSTIASPIPLADSAAEAIQSDEMSRGQSRPSLTGAGTRPGPP